MKREFQLKDTLNNYNVHQQTAKAAKMTMELIQILEKTVSSGRIEFQKLGKNSVKIRKIRQKMVERKPN